MTTVKRIIAPLLFGLVGAAILVWLGTWQVQRLAWKEGVLAQIEATISGPSVALPATPDPEADLYLPVALSGDIEARALRVLVSVKQRGAGYRLISALETPQGRRVLVDRGYVPLEQVPVLKTGPVSVTGNLNWPDDRNSSTPENDVADNTWFARDIDLMAAELATEPLLVIARDLSPADKGLTPMPVNTSGIPNDHKHYAITWFSLAVVWLLMTGVWVSRRLTGKD